MFISNFKEQIIENKKKIIILLIILVLLILFLFLKKEETVDKVYKDSDIIFTDEQTKGDYVSYLPYINLDSDEILEANKAIINIYYDTINSNDYYMVYDYYINDDIVSLIIKIYNKYIDGDMPENIYFYNIDMNRKILIDDFKLKNRFNVTNDDIQSRLKELLKEYYDYEINKKYINNCDFNCYLQNVGDLNLAEYYVRDNNLYAYLFFTTDSSFIYDEDKPFELFNFKIK